MSSAKHLRSQRARFYFPDLFAWHTGAIQAATDVRVACGYGDHWTHHHVKTVDPKCRQETTFSLF
jgi:hypothetical protein